MSNAEIMDDCEKIVFEWKRDDEPDARVLVIKIAEILSGERRAESNVEAVIGRIKMFAKDHALTGYQLEQMFEMGSAAYQSFRPLTPMGFKAP